MTNNYFLNGYEHWKETLTSNEQKCYEQMLTYLKMASKKFKISQERINSDHVEYILECIRRDHPEILWMQKMVFCNYYFISNDTRYVHCASTHFFKYILTNKQIEKYKKLVYRKARKIANEAMKLEDDVQKMRYVHDELIKTTKYKLYNYKNSKVLAKYQSMISLFESKKAVCLGYAQTFKYIMDMLGIKCYVEIKHKSKHNGHAWNKVFLNNKWVSIDVTNDRGYNNEPTYYHFLETNYTLW